MFPGLFLVTSVSRIVDSWKLIATNHLAYGLIILAGGNQQPSCLRCCVKSSELPCVTMDSAAAFKERAKVLGISPEAITKLSDAKLATFGQFAFLSSFQPGSTDEQPFVDSLTKVLGTTPEAPELACWRRLYYECHTAAMSELRCRLERKEDDGPRKLLMPERVERLERAKRKLVGITIDNQLEPAHRLVDLAVQQAEDATLRYIPLKDCLSREAELQHSRTEPAIEFQPDGTMKLSKKQLEIKAETSGDLKVRMALQRRALAYHIAGICSYQNVDVLIQRMFALMTKEPVKGFRAVSLQQVINADRELWIVAAQEARGKSLMDPSKPLDAILEQAFKAPEVSYHLLPLPLAGGGGKGDHAVAPRDTPRGEGPVKRPFKGANTFPAKRNKGKGKGIDLPTGCIAETGAGQRICFQYNRKRCNHQDKDRCPRGLHVCWAKNCGGKHPHGDCNNQS